jgi:hypothetical protein
VNDGDCATVAGRPVCDTSQQKCVECNQPSDCAVADARCSQHSCLGKGQCASSSDCTTPTVCDTNQKQCVRCVQDSDCYIGNVCSSGKCSPKETACTGATTPVCWSAAAGGICVSPRNTCGCSYLNGDGDCFGRAYNSHCDGTKAVCVQCYEDSHCSNGKTCVDNSCL